MHLVHTILTLKILASTILIYPASASAEFRTDTLAARIETLERETGSGRLGVGLVDLTDGDAWSWRGDESFPMQSVYKLPIALAVLTAADEGRLNLDDPIALGREDLSIQWSPIAREFKGERASYTVRQLLEHALQLSDNTASDVLLRLTGGPGSVTALLHRHGISGMRVDRPEREMQPEALGLPPFRPEWANETALAAALNDLPHRSGARLWWPTLPMPGIPRPRRQRQPFLQSWRVVSFCPSLRHVSSLTFLQALAPAARALRPAFQKGRPSRTRPAPRWTF